MMNIKVIFEADSIERLREQMEMFLGPKPTFADQVREAAKKAKKAVAAAPTPEPQTEPSDEGITNNGKPDITVLDAAETEEETVTPEAQKAVELMKLKDQQLSRLRDLFNAGKGPFVRELLAKYGNGAKVFPEVEAKHFPAIKVELDRELGAH